MLIIALGTTTTFGQSRASGTTLKAPPKTLPVAIAKPIATPPAVATPSATVPTTTAPYTKVEPIVPRSSLGAATNARLPNTVRENLDAAREIPRRLFAPAASSRVQPPQVDPFSKGRPLISETVPATPPILTTTPAPITLGTDDDVFIEAPHDGYFGDSRFPYDPNAYLDWTPQFLPAGLIYRSYLAGVKESRMATVFEHDKRAGWMWDITLGGRVGLFRYGSTNPIRPEGFEVDVEGSAQPRLDLENNEDLQSVDFRAGLPITYGIGRWATKAAFYHISAHAGDEYMVSHPTFQRINYVRDEFVLGQSYYITDDLRLYAEAGWAFNADVAKPWEFQFGADYSPLAPSKRGSPFAAINGYIRQEQNYSGNLVVQAGWQWRPWNEGKLLRVGLQYYNGKSNQFEFYNVNENKVGLGIWYDF
ncbi:MAG: DUF1207 domain-containing protein [Planctomycetia bacterium]|nr:DUF1207 domain-containing protein [Planctomycetia bacterium]